MASTRQLSIRDRIQYRAFLLFYWHFGNKFFADGSRNPEYIADTGVRMGAAVFSSRDELFDKTMAERPELIERFEVEFSHSHSGGGIRNRRSFVNG